MYGTPAGSQVAAGQWQHEALHQAEAHRRTHTDSDFERHLVRQHAHALQLRIVALAATVVAAFALISIV